MNPLFQHLDELHLPPQPFNAREELLRVLNALVVSYRAEKIIAFGSCVRGGVTKDSDVDLCIIRDHPPACTHPALEAEAVASLTLPRISTDLVVRSPAQMRLAAAAPFGIMTEILNNGIALYER